MKIAKYHNFTSTDNTNVKHNNFVQQLIMKQKKFETVRGAE